MGTHLELLQRRTIKRASKLARYIRIFLNSTVGAQHVVPLLNHLGLILQEAQEFIRRLRNVSPQLFARLPPGQVFESRKRQLCVRYHCGSYVFTWFRAGLHNPRQGRIAWFIKTFMARKHRGQLTLYNLPRPLNLSACGSLSRPRVYVELGYNGNVRKPQELCQFYPDRTLAVVNCLLTAEDDVILPLTHRVLKQGCNHKRVQPMADLLLDVYINCPVSTHCQRIKNHLVCTLRTDRHNGQLSAAQPFLDSNSLLYRIFIERVGHVRDSRRVHKRGCGQEFDGGFQSGHAPGAGYYVHKQSVPVLFILEFWGAFFQECLQTLFPVLGCKDLPEEL